MTRSSEGGAGNVDGVESEARCVVCDCTVVNGVQLLSVF